ncbi:hypothetical protein L226DRAFT_540957 [Lentinus tigrinus ALCF2SS1-7]|uniref:uncharacterized protein n=1 Tax=Lentinus tigrinus ALCF2SS1-7 TaxID=1328758 RepID=UPI0011663D78|nr:hypothetical protein L226DRAFT_540957 [Lentinus tigrinus ALCF2SS1-7]
MSPSAPEADVRGFVQFLPGGRMQETMDEGSREGWKEGFVPRCSGRDLRGMSRIDFKYVRPEPHRPRAMSVLGRREHISI